MHSPTLKAMTLVLGAILLLATGCGGVTNENVKTHVVTEKERQEAAEMMSNIDPMKRKPADTEKKK